MIESESRPGSPGDFEEKKPDMVNHPAHYNQGGIESIDVIEAFKLGFCDGNAIKYIFRHQYKGSPLEDLKKARWYLNRLIEQMEAPEDAVS